MQRHYSIPIKYVYCPLALFAKSTYLRNKCDQKIISCVFQHIYIYYFACVGKSVQYVIHLCNFVYAMFYNVF